MFNYILKRLCQNFSLYSRALNGTVTIQQLIGKEMEERGDILNTIRAYFVQDPRKKQ